MNHHLNQHHNSSEEEFMDALEKFEETLDLRDLEPSPKPAPTPARKVTQPQHRPQQELLLSALEEAAADIDQFIASKNLHSDQS